MSDHFDMQAVQRAAQGRGLRLPSGPHRGKAGDVRAASIGSSLELHDFRNYHPGDDLRHLDWNAVARTGELVVRVRQDEVSPRIEIILDASASMAVSDVKAARAREITAWLCVLAQRTRFEPVLFVAGHELARATAQGALELARSTQMSGTQGLDAVLPGLSLKTCGLRVLVTDCLFDANPAPIVERLSRGAAGLAVLQVLDREDLTPSTGYGAKLIDAETRDSLERLLTHDIVEAYRERLGAHLTAWQAATTRVHGRVLQVIADRTLDELVRTELAPLIDTTGDAS